MRTDKRIEKLENQIPDGQEPQFVYWIGHPWTEEEKAAAIKKHPNQKLFWRSLRETILFKKQQEDAGKQRE